MDPHPTSTFRPRLDSLIGKPAGRSGRSTAPDPVNQPMIRHWAAAVQHAAMAVATGAAEVVVVDRAFNERSGLRFGSIGGSLSTMPLWLSWYAPFGLLSPASWVAGHARRFMHDYGATSEHFGRIAVVARHHTATNPGAWFYQRPITIDDHQNSRWVVEPVLRLLDCCQESDGGVALVVTSVERAKDLRQRHDDVTTSPWGGSTGGRTPPLGRWPSTRRSRQAVSMPARSSAARQSRRIVK